MKVELLVLALFPVVACVIWIYLKDKYDKEPILVLCKFFLLGAFISILAILIENLLMRVRFFEGYSYLMYIAFIVAGVTEEGLKALVLIPNLLKEKSFNEKLDGIVYSIFLSLGFATIENIIYVVFENNSVVFEVGLTRGVISIPAHIMFAIAMGFYISKYKFSSEDIKKREYLIMSILIPILLHGFFDFILMLDHKWYIIVFVVYTIFLWKINLDKLDEYTKNSEKSFFKIRKDKKESDR